MDRFEEQFKHTFDQLDPDEQQKDRIWRNVQSQMTHEKRRYSFAHTAAACVCTLAICVVMGVGVNAATGGTFFESLKTFIGMPQQQQKVATESAALGTRESGVYADPLVACSDEYIIYANERGLMVYGRAEQQILAAVDLQALDCNYFNADSISTHVMMKDNVLYIFNEYQDKNTREVYSYNLAQAGDEDALGYIDDAEEIAQIKGEWQAYSNIYSDTFDTFEIAQTQWNGSSDLHYSKDSIKWTDSKGVSHISCLVVHTDGTYELYTAGTDDTTDVQTETLNVETTTGSASSSELPKFTYSGDDAILKTLCSYMYEQYSSLYLSDGAVYIPAPVVCKTYTDGDEVTVFANLWSFTYQKNGNTLDCESGGEQPSRLTLKSDGNGGYTVIEQLSAGDGEEYDSDIQAFCEGYSISASDFVSEGQDYDTIRKELIKMYVDDNNLDIKYYKDYGWDPVELN